MRTRYTYTLVKASDAPGAALDGVISAISQKSDFIVATVNTYPFFADATHFTSYVVSSTLHLQPVRSITFLTISHINHNV